MLNAMAQVGAFAGLAAGLYRVQHLAVGLVADGVDKGSQTGPAGLADGFLQMLGRGDGDAIVVRLSLKGREHVGRACPQPAIGKELNAADAQPLVAKTALKPRLDGGV